MIIKQVKEYGKKTKRQRIELNNKDGLETGTQVALIPLEDYQETQTRIADLENLIMDIQKELTTLRPENKSLKQQLDTYKKQENNLKEIIEDVTAPIHTHYESELEKKDNQIKELQDQLNRLDRESINYNLELNGFNGFELIVMRKHKNLVKQFTGAVDLIMKRSDREIVEADAPALSDKQQNNKPTKQ